MKSYDTVEAIGNKIDEIIERIETGDMDGDDNREVNMVLRCLQQRADLIRSHVMESEVAGLKDQLVALLARSPHLKVVR